MIVLIGDLMTEARSTSQTSHDPTGTEHFNLKMKIEQHSVRRQLADVQDGEPASAPYVVEIDPTTACNLQCPECISGGLLNKGSLDGDVLAETIDSLASMGTKAVIFIGGGEPMAHPRFSDLVRRAHRGGIKVGITTNGTLIDRHLAAVAECAAWTRVSVDAGTPSTFSFFRPSRGDRFSFTALVDQMTRLAKVRTGVLGYSFLLLRRGDRDNIADMVTAATIARDIGCDYIEFKPSMEMDHSLSGWSADHRTAIAESLKLSKELETSTFKVLVPASFLHVMDGTTETEQPKDYHWCPATHYRTVVTPSGCYVCPYHRGQTEFKYADLRTKSFREIWGSSEHRKVLAKIDPAENCRFHCIRHEQNTRFLEGLSEGGGTPDFDPFI
jgi:MoaA/NifB/PqqE/SkfB family radical SAM enzyme